MCGIVGYVGKKNAVPVLIDGLKRLEYRGYDSAGIAIIQDNSIVRNRIKGKIAELEKKIEPLNYESNIGIGHTRWATHGKPSEENAHPHIDCKSNFVVVHNGIIENYIELKNELIKKGHKFQSETDTEVIVHLIEQNYEEKNDIKEAFLAAINQLVGSFAIAMISLFSPDKIFVARLGSPLVIGLGQGEHILASDIPAILQYTKDVIILDEYQCAILQADRIELFDFSGNPIRPTVKVIPWDPIMAEKGGYRHFMLKEIYEQPRVIAESIQGRIYPESSDIHFEDQNFNTIDFSKFNHIKIVACGTSYHAGLVGKFYFEKFTRIPVEVDIASEYRYRDLLVNEKTLGIFISQSGETADTLAALRITKKLGGTILSICNVIGSTMTRESDLVIYTHAGPEIGVASTKAFTTQLVALYMLSLFISKKLNLIADTELGERLISLYRLPNYIDEALNKNEKHIEILAKKFMKKSDFLYLGRSLNYPIALEGALKLKEISYIHAEGYPAGEMKHGPIALIDENMPVVAIATASEVYEKMIGNLEEVRARDGIVLSLINYGDEKIKQKSDEVIEVPLVDEMLSPIVNVVPLQLLAYHIAVKLGNDVDQPRNLAKSVTVE